MSPGQERHRRSIRLPHHDYRSVGAYFITICTYNRASLFDESRYRAAAEEQWALSPGMRQEIGLDAFVVMPNHIHGIVWITNDGNLVGAQGVAPLRNPHVAPRSLGAFVRGYKAAVTREVNLLRDTPGFPVWQRNYYEHVVRSEDDLRRIRQYILENPLRWAFDRENPHGATDARERHFWAQRALVGAQGLAPLR